MKKIPIIFLFFLIGCVGEVPDNEKEDICVKIWMVDGRSYDTKFRLPKNRSALQVNTDRGSYYLQYVDERWWHGHWVTVKTGVIDHKVVNCH